MGRADLWRPFENGYQSALASTTFILLPITLAASALTYLAIEKPFLSMRRQYVSVAPPA